MVRRISLLSVLVVTAAIVGCGADVPPPTTLVETAQQPAKPPTGWRTQINNDHGFSISVPPAWNLSSGSDTALYRSPDHLVAVTISADRTAEAFESSPAQFAKQAMRALPGYTRKLTPSPAHPIKGTPLEAVEVSAKGITKNGGVRQRVEVAVLRRDRQVNYTAVIAANADATPPDELAAALQMVASLRDHPLV